VRATAEFVVSIDPKIISTHEIYEIYKVIQGERNSTMSKQIASVTENIRIYMEAAGYTYKKDAVIAGGTRTNIFCKDEQLVRGDLRDYEEDFGRYIDETMVNHRPIRRLRSDMTQAIHPQVRRMLNKPTLDL
jgi:Ni,Fe-hydrogenase III large subunit